MSASGANFNRVYEETTVTKGSLIELAMADGLLDACIKSEVETAIKREGCLPVFNIMEEKSRSTACCQLLKKKKNEEKVFFTSKWRKGKSEAEREVILIAAQSYSLLDSQGIPLVRTWCTGMLYTCISKYFKQGVPVFSHTLNNIDNPNMGFFCEVTHEELANLYAEDFPKVRGNTFAKKKEATQDAALQALKIWKYGNALNVPNAAVASEELSSSDSSDTSSSE